MANLAAARRRGLVTDLDAIIDVGANTGQYAYMAHNVWPAIPILSFEPNPEAYTDLSRTFGRHHIPGKCFQLAVGAACTQTVLRLQTDSAQSSVLRRIGTRHDAEREISVQCTTLDQIRKDIPPFNRGLLKVDTQGFELPVLAGAKAFLKQCAYVQLEVAFRPAYEGQPYAADVLLTMRNFGFACIEILDVLRDRRARGFPIIEMDLLFARQETKYEED